MPKTKEELAREEEAQKQAEEKQKAARKQQEEMQKRAIGGDAKQPIKNQNPNDNKERDVAWAIVKALEMMKMPKSMEPGLGAKAKKAFNNFTAACSRLGGRIKTKFSGGSQSKNSSQQGSEEGIELQEMGGKREPSGAEGTSLKTEVQEVRERAEELRAAVKGDLSVSEEVRGKVEHLVTMAEKAAKTVERITEKAETPSAGPSVAAEREVADTETKTLPRGLMGG